MTVSPERVRKALPGGGPAVAPELLEGFLTAAYALVELRAGEEYTDTPLGEEIIRLRAVASCYRVIEPADGRGGGSPNAVASEALADSLLDALDANTSGVAEEGGINERLVSNVIPPGLFTPGLLGFPYEPTVGP